MKIIGRKKEADQLRSLLTLDGARLLAVIGRRRVGKTYLIRQVYKEHIVFEMTGLNNAGLDEQLLNFRFQLKRYFPSQDVGSDPESWLAAFHALTERLERSSVKEKPVVFFDELPWIASPRSGFLEAFAHWWNNWASRQQLVVVICGSAASWMLNHVVNAKGGLHNRITNQLLLEPFDLKETKEFLEYRGVQISEYQIVQLYMAIGGIPHYLEQVQRGKSTVQNIQDMCFSKTGMLYNEFDNLYAALFNNPQNYIAVIKALAGKTSGMSRQEILDATGLTDGGGFSTILSELEVSGFILSLQPLENKKKDTLFRLKDEFSLFYLRFMDGHRNTEANHWQMVSQSQPYKIWCGYAFENVSMRHIAKIKDALGISGIYVEAGSFVHRPNEVYPKGFQIDLLMNRKDDVYTVCEMKFYSDQFVIDKKYAETLNTRREGLKALHGSRKSVQIAMITTFGTVDNTYKLDYVDHDLTMSVFFA